jgi:NitT/TauT family transport system substrate-binding protein
MSKGMNRRQLLAAAGAAALVRPASVFAADGKIIYQVGSPSPNTGYVHVYAARELGYFKQEGIELDIRFSHGAPLATQLVSSGGADCGSFTYEPMILGYSKGLRGKFVFGKYHKTIYYIAIPKKSPLKSVKDLAGKKIGIVSLSSSAIPIAKAILDSAGVDVGSVQFVPVGFGASVMQALKSGQVDAIAEWNAAYGALERLGADFNYFRHPKLASIGNGGIMASEEMLTKRKGDLTKLCRGMAKGMAFFFANKDAALELFWKANPALRPAGSKAHAYEVAKMEMKHVIDDMAPPKGPDGRPIYGAIDLHKVQDYIDIFSKEMKIAKPPKATDIADDSLVKAFNDFDLAKVQEQARKWHT